jgi:hypothetical protein
MSTLSNEERGPPASTPYAKPRVSRLGTFRQLTRGSGAAFAGILPDIVGCVVTASSSCPVPT